MTSQFDLGVGTGGQIAKQCQRNKSQPPGMEEQLYLVYMQEGLQEKTQVDEGIQKAKDQEFLIEEKEIKMKSFEETRQLCLEVGRKLKELDPDFDFQVATNPQKKVVSLEIAKGGVVERLEFFYLPEPPADLETVFGLMQGSLFVYISTGSFEIDSAALLVYLERMRGGLQIEERDILDQWYHPSTGDHSPDFPIEKIPVKFRHPKHKVDLEC